MGIVNADHRDAISSQALAGGRKTQYCSQGTLRSGVNRRIASKAQTMLDHLNVTGGVECKRRFGAPVFERLPPGRPGVSFVEAEDPVNESNMIDRQDITCIMARCGPRFLPRRSRVTVSLY